MTIPFQKPEQLRKSIYEAVENERLQYNKEISFPIIAVLNAYAVKEEEVELIVIRHEYENSIENYKTLCSEIQEFEQEKGCKCVMKEVVVPYNDLIDTHLDTFGKLITYMEEGDTIYACMTYGSKPIPIVEMMALNYAYRAKKNTEIGCIAYGQVDHNDNKMKIYDMTPLFYMDEIVKNVAEMNVKDPLAAIKSILTW